ncbi:MAG: VanZ family protein, partial [Bacteroidales bacterium]|nr:VanZ family protein [Bacteroidales bacterium]
RGLRAQLPPIIDAFSAGVGFALLTEIGQGLSGYRSMEAADLLADSLGIAFGACASAVFVIIQHKKNTVQ